MGKQSKVDRSFQRIRDFMRKKEGDTLEKLQCPFPKIDVCVPEVAQDRVASNPSSEGCIPGSRFLAEDTGLLEDWLARPLRPDIRARLEVEFRLHLDWHQGRHVSLIPMNASNCKYSNVF